MALIKAVVLALVAGLAGALAWAVVGYYTHFEIGWLAWGIGALVGAAARFGASSHAGMRSGLVAVVIAVLAVLAGKGGVIGAEIMRYVHENPPPVVTEENLISYYADDVAAEFEAGGRAVVWPPSGAERGQGWVESDYPADVWAEASERWRGLAPGEQAAHRETVERQVAYTPEFYSHAFSDMFTKSLSVFDALWFCLAVMTAYRLGSSRRVGVVAGASAGPGDGTPNA